MYTLESFRVVKVERTRKKQKPTNGELSENTTWPPPTAHPRPTVTCAPPPYKIRTREPVFTRLYTAVYRRRVAINLNLEQTINSRTLVLRARLRPTPHPPPLVRRFAEKQTRPTRSVGTEMLTFATAQIHYDTDVYNFLCSGQRF